MSTLPSDPRAALVDAHPRLAPLLGALDAAVELIVASQNAGGWLFVCGNGGSAADAEHIVGELMKSFLLPRSPASDLQARLVSLDPAWRELAPRLQRGVRAYSLVAPVALTSAIANDQHAHLVYAQQLFAVLRPVDVVLGLSTSGNSANVVRALQLAQSLGAPTIAFTGSAPAALDACSTVILKAPATDTYRVQEYHLPLYHALCALVEHRLFGPGAGVVASRT